MKKKILICEDDEGITEVLGIILEENNFQALFLSSAKNINKKIEEFSPNIIILDVLMPQLDGRKVTKYLKGNPRTKKIPILLFSALNGLDKITKEYEADGYIEKPFKTQTLLTTLKKHIHKS